MTDNEKVQPADEEGHETEVAVENGEAGEVVIGDEVEVAMVVDEKRVAVVEEDKEVAVQDYKTGVEEDDGGRNRKVVYDKSVQQDIENYAGTNDLGEETPMETSQAVANIESIGEQTKKRKSSDWTSDSFNEAILEDDGDMNPESFNRGNTNITSYMNADCCANFLNSI